jgi:hypothetical protein
MAITSKREAARVLRIEADSILRHGLDDISTYTYDCIQAQTLRKERCANCLLREYLPESAHGEEYPCQHIEPEKYAQIMSAPGMQEKVVRRLNDLATELELAATAEES